AVHRLGVGQRIDRLVLPSPAEGTPGLVLQAGAPQPQLLELPLEALDGGDELRQAGPDLAQGTELALMGEIERRGRVVQPPCRAGRLGPGTAEVREPAHQTHQPSRPAAGTAATPSGAGSLPFWSEGEEPGELPLPATGTLRVARSAWRAAKPLPMDCMTASWIPSVPLKTTRLSMSPTGEAAAATMSTARSASCWA